MEWLEIHLDTIDSTNDYAKRNAHQWDPQQIVCITAEGQTKGRGRYQRKWVSPYGVNLYVSICFRLPLNFPHISSLALMLTHSLAFLLEKEGLKPKIKWPNDVQIEGKKISGILCETLFCSDSIQVILGIGINLNMTKQELDLIGQPATSLLQATGKHWDKKDFLKKLQEIFLEDLSLFLKEGFAPFVPFFEDRLAFKGENVCYFDGQNTWEGICHSLTDTGALKLLTPDRHFLILLSGEKKEKG